jgi:acetyl esterase/lipase
MALLSRILASGTLLVLSACTSAGFSLLNVPAALKGGYAVHETAYGPGPLDQLDIYVPDGEGTDARDVIVFLYGGRWQSGKKAHYRFVATALAQRGFITVIPDFGKYPVVRFPAFVDDGARALAWVTDHIAEYGGRPDRIHLTGHSSGAHVAALLTVDPHYLQSQGKAVRSVIKSFAGLAGPYAFTPTDADLMQIFGPPHRYPEMQATRFVTGQEPPMLLLYGEQDEQVKPGNHERLAERIRATGGCVEVITYPELGHVGLIGTFSGFGPASSVVDDMAAFFRARN